MWSYMSSLIVIELHINFMIFTLISKLLTFSTFSNDLYAEIACAASKQKNLLADSTRKQLHIP